MADLSSGVGVPASGPPKGTVLLFCPGSGDDSPDHVPDQFLINPQFPGLSGNLPYYGRFPPGVQNGKAHAGLPAPHLHHQSPALVQQADELLIHLGNPLSKTIQLFVGLIRPLPIQHGIIRHRDASSGSGSRWANFTRVLRGT